MKEFIEKLIGRLGEQQAEAENEMHRLRSGDYTLPCSYDITDIKEIASESFKESIQIVNELAEEYKDAEEQGKLVLYPTNAYFIMNNKVYEGWVQEAVYSVCRKPLFDIRYDDNSLNSYRGYLGNTVFLERAEAEAKLKELKGESE